MEDIVLLRLMSVIKTVSRMLKNSFNMLTIAIAMFTGINDMIYCTPALLNNEIRRQIYFDPICVVSFLRQKKVFRKMFLQVGSFVRFGCIIESEMAFIEHSVLKGGSI